MPPADSVFYPHSPREIYIRDATLGILILVVAVLTAGYVSDTRDRMRVLEGRGSAMRNELDLARRQASQAAIDRAVAEAVRRSADRAANAVMR
jgi:hypothetical protein